MQAGEQIPLIPDEVTEEIVTKEVLVPMKPHEFIEALERIVNLNEEVKEQEDAEEKEKARHKDAKDSISAAIESARTKLSQLIEQTGTKRRRSLEKVRVQSNHTQRIIREFIGDGTMVDERAMTAGEYQLKLAIEQSEAQEDNVVPITGGADAGDDPASFEDGAVDDSDFVAPSESEESELGENAVDDEG